VQQLCSPAILFLVEKRKALRDFAKLLEYVKESELLLAIPNSSRASELIL